MYPNFDALLYNVVDDEEAEYELACHHEVVPGSNIAQQLDGSECPGGDHTPRRRQFEHQSGGDETLSGGSGGQ